MHMKTLSIILIFVLAFACTVPADDGSENLASAESVRLFDPGVFGKTPSDPVTLLLPGNEGIEPTSIQVDLHDGEYSAAMITYGKIDFEIVRRALNVRYKRLSGN